MKDIAGYEGLYAVTEDGRVWSHRQGIYLKAKGTGKERGKPRSYRKVLLQRDGVRKDKYIHRLVAETYIPNPDNLPCVNHVDGNGSNNHASNLEWCTQHQNTLHTKRMGRTTVRERNPQAKLTSRDVILIRGLYTSGQYSQSQLGRIFQVTTSNISHICRRVNWPSVR